MVFLVLCLLKLLLRAKSAASLKASNIAYISIVLIVRIISASIINYFLVGFRYKLTF